MGMYTGLRCKVIVKEEYRDLIKDFTDNELDWSDISSTHEFINEFSEGFRANSIPYGSLSYMPDEWENVPLDDKGNKNWFAAKATDGFDRNFNRDTGFWSFQCSLKNYDSDIERFFKLILKNIAEKIIHLEYYYEEMNFSQRYDFFDGEIRCVNKNFIQYKKDYDDYYFGQ